MIWALVSSAYVIYLYRKLNADDAQAPQEPGLDSGEMAAELDQLTKRIGAIEAKLAGKSEQETSR